MRLKSNIVLSHWFNRSYNHRDWIYMISRKWICHPLWNRRNYVTVRIHEVNALLVVVVGDRKFVWFIIPFPNFVLSSSWMDFSLKASTQIRLLAVCTAFFTIWLQIDRHPQFFFLHFSTNPITSSTINRFTQTGLNESLRCYSWKRR